MIMALAFIQIAGGHTPVINWDINAGTLVTTIGAVGIGVWRILTKVHEFDKTGAVRHQENLGKFDKLTTSHETLSRDVQRLSTAQERADIEHKGIALELKGVAGSVNTLERVVDLITREKSSNSLH